MNYTIPTTQIVNLTRTVNKWILSNCGGIVYGNSRVGKTRTVHYITKSLRESCKFLLPVYERIIFSEKRNHRTNLKNGSGACAPEPLCLQSEPLTFQGFFLYTNLEDFFDTHLALYENELIL